MSRRRKPPAPATGDSFIFISPPKQGISRTAYPEMREIKVHPDGSIDTLLYSTKIGHYPTLEALEADHPGMRWVAREPHPPRWGGRIARAATWSFLVLSVLSAAEAVFMVLRPEVLGHSVVESILLAGLWFEMFRYRREEQR